MAEEQTILASERLRDDLLDFRRLLRARYRPATRQVTADDHRKHAANLAERWLVEIAHDQGLAVAIGPAVLANLNVHFQRVLTFAEHATTRTRYETEFHAILDSYTVNVVLPLKQTRGRLVQTPPPTTPDRRIVHSAFVGQSFMPIDKKVNECVFATLEALGVKVITGERPKADSISEKVKRLIEEQSIFVGLFTRRDKIARKPEWTTSAWVIDEKAYAVGRQKPLILLKEQGVGSIGGIQGDYEYIEFSREGLEGLTLKLIQLFHLTNNGLWK